MTTDTTPFAEPDTEEPLETWALKVNNYPCDGEEVVARTIAFGPIGDTVRVLAEFGMDDSTLDITVGNGPSVTSPDPEGTPLELIAELLEQAALMIRGGVAEHDPSAVEAASVTDHGFVGVAGHPDDDECTYRNDATGDPYCGAARDEHQDRGEE